MVPGILILPNALDVVVRLRAREAMAAIAAVFVTQSGVFTTSLLPGYAYGHGREN
jgi:hypothetical protein